MKNVTLIDRMIKKSLYSLLSEQSNDNSSSEDTEETPQDQSQRSTSDNSNAGVISTAGAFGSGGRAKAFVTSAGARAAEDPEGLLNDLGVYSKVAGSSLESALEIIRKAIHSNVVMAEAYEGAKISSEKIETRSGKQTKRAIAVTLKELDRKNGIRFLAHTLEAAKNADYLRLNIGLQFGQSNTSDIVIYAF